MTLHNQSNHDKRSPSTSLSCTRDGLHSQSKRTGRACVLTFEAVLTGGGALSFFLYPQYDTIALEHPILGGCQPGAATLSAELSFHQAGARAATATKFKNQKLNSCLSVFRSSSESSQYLTSEVPDECLQNKTWNELWIRLLV